MACGTVSDLVKLIRERMRLDCGDERFTQEQIIARISLAYKATYTIRPDLFDPVTLDHKLVPGADQNLPKDVTLFEFLGTGYKNSLTGTVEQCTDAAKPAAAQDDFISIYKSRCKQSTATSVAVVDTPQAKCSSFAISSYSHELRNGTYFSVSPVVPEGKDVYVKLLVRQCPKCDLDSLDADVPCKLFAPLYEKALSFMYETDDEDQMLAQRAQAHEAKYAALMREMYVTDSRMASGYFIGQTPEGKSDPQWRQRG